MPGCNPVILSGDSHNAWAHELVDSHGKRWPSACLEHKSMHKMHAGAVALQRPCPACNGSSGPCSWPCSGVPSLLVPVADDGRGAAAGWAWSLTALLLHLLGSPRISTLDSRKRQAATPPAPRGPRWEYLLWVLPRKPRPRACPPASAGGVVCSHVPAAMGIHTLDKGRSSCGKSRHAPVLQPRGKSNALAAPRPACSARFTKHCAAYGHRPVCSNARATRARRARRRPAGTCAAVERGCLPCAAQSRGFILLHITKRRCHAEYHYVVSTALSVAGWLAFFLAVECLPACLPACLSVAYCCA